MLKILSQKVTISFVLMGVLLSVPLGTLLLLTACATSPEVVSRTTEQDPDLFDTTSRTIAPLPTAQIPNQIAEGQEFVVNVNPNDPDSKEFKFLYDWDGNGVFDDVSSSGEVHHTYQQNGNYKIQIRVQDEKQNTADIGETIRVSDSAPQAQIRISGDSMEGDWVKFDASESKSLSDPITKYEWDFSYNGKLFKSAGQQGEKVENRWLKNGSFTVALRVTDSDGSSDIASQVVQIVDQGPKARIIGPTELKVGEAATFSGQDSTSVVDSISGYYWDTRYSSSADNFKPGKSQIRLMWKVPGDYSLALKVVDSDGSSDTAVLDVYVKSPPELKPVFKKQPKSKKPAKGGKKKV